MIKNKKYKEFLDNGFIEIINLHGLKRLLKGVDGIRGRHIPEARALVIGMYYTGMRPEEMFNMYQGMVYPDPKGITYCIVDAPAAKNGLRRLIPLHLDKPFVKEFMDYCWNQYPKILLFRNFKGKYVRHYEKKDGTVVQYVETSYKFRWHFYRWSKQLFPDGIPPYYLRHNRFSKLMMTGKVDSLQIKQLKGAKSMDSVTPYLHLDMKMAKRTALHND